MVAKILQRKSTMNTISLDSMVNDFAFLCASSISDDARPMAVIAYTLIWPPSGIVSCVPASKPAHMHAGRVCCCASFPRRNKPRRPSFR